MPINNLNNNHLTNAKVTEILNAITALENALAMLNAVRIDVGIDKSPISYNGELWI
mgnify:CR=1 FL=1